MAQARAAKLSSQRRTNATVKFKN